MTLSSLVDASAAELSPAKKIYQGVTPLQWSVRMADSEIARLGDSLDWKPDGRAKWDYAAGLFTLSLLELNVCAPDTNYVSFSEKAIGSFITADGNIKKYRPAEYQLDALNPGKTALALWRLTRESRYQQAAARLVQQLKTQPRTPDGGFWHKEKYTNQIWLDGIYMAEPFYAEYAKTFGEPKSAFDDIALQFRLVDEHLYDSRTGLFFHAWDAAKIQPWANPLTGCSSNIWARSVGWLAMALVDTLDYFPTNHPARPHIMATFQKLAGNVARYQDSKTGLWWQVMNLGERKGNYLEASASAMFLYALAKGVNRGYLSRDFIPVIDKGYAGMIQNLVRPDGKNHWSLIHCCSVAGLGFKNSAGRARDGSFDYYISEPVVANDLKGIGSFILAGIEWQQLIGENHQPGR